MAPPRAPDPITGVARRSAVRATAHHRVEEPVVEGERLLDVTDLECAVANGRRGASRQDQVEVAELVPQVAVCQRGRVGALEERASGHGLE